MRARFTKWGRLIRLDTLFNLQTNDSYPMADQWLRFQDSVQRHLEYVPALTLDYSINVSLKHEYIFVETPKVACSTIKLNLQRLETGLPNFVWEEEKDVHNRDFSPLLKPSQVLDFESLLAKDNFYKFCFVRSPYSRLLSCYLDKIVGNKPPKQSILNILGYKDKKEFHTPVSFRQFVDAITLQSAGHMNPHWRPQYYQTFQSSIPFDFIGRFETFSSDLQKVLGVVCPKEMTTPAKEARHQTSAAEKMSHYYDDSLVEKVAKIYEVDFEAFGYDRKMPG